jgi:hypothetical protein
VSNQLLDIQIQNKIEKLVFLIDSTIGCPGSPVNGSDPNKLFYFQLQLMTILSTVLNCADTYPVFFNNGSALSCQRFSDMNCCQTFAFVDTKAPVPFPASCEADDILPACTLGYYALSTYRGMNGTNKGYMAIAIVNSGLNLKNNDVIKPCFDDFPIRYVIGTDEASPNDLERFQSNVGYNVFVPYNDNNRVTMENLFDCIGEYYYFNKQEIFCDKATADGNIIPSAFPEII